jgi:hypothetical protein
MADGVAEKRVVPLELADQLACIRIDHQLVGIEPVAGIGLIGAVHPIPVQQSGTGIGQIAVPHLVGVFRQIDAALLLAGGVEKAELDSRRMRREKGEVHAQAVPGRAQREWPSFAKANAAHFLGSTFSGIGSKTRISGIGASYPLDTSVKDRLRKPA